MLVHFQKWPKATVTEILWQNYLYKIDKGAGNKIKKIIAVCVLFLIKLRWPKIRTNVFMIHYIISMLRCLDHSVKITTRLECKCLF